MEDRRESGGVGVQAMDRAHRIGQKKPVQVFRFCTEHAIEEKVCCCVPTSAAFFCTPLFCPSVLNLAAKNDAELAGFTSIDERSRPGTSNISGLLYLFSRRLPQQFSAIAQPCSHGGPLCIRTGTGVLFRGKGNCISRSTQNGVVC